MKHLLVIFALALSISVKAQIPESPTIQSVELQIIKKGGTIMPLPKSPITPPTASIDGHTLYLYDVTSLLALTVVDENQQVVYTAYVPAGNTTLVLPTTLTGTFELQLYPGGDYYFAAEITL